MNKFLVLSVLLLLTVVGGATMQVMAASLYGPWISPDGGTYGEPIQVSMKCSNSAAAIYYTTDGTEPTEASIRYTGPFTVDEDMTISAIAVMGSTVTEVKSETYRFVPMVHVANIAAYEQVPDGTLVGFDNGVFALADSYEYLYVCDASGYAVIKGSTDHYYRRGSCIPAGFQGIKVTSGGEPMLTEPKNFAYDTGTSNVEAEYITAENVGPDKFAHLVSLDSVKFHMSWDYNGSGGTLTDKFGNSCPILFGTMGVIPPENESVSYNIEAVVGSLETEDGIEYLLLPVKFDRLIPDEDPLEITPSQVGPETLGRPVVLKQVTFPNGTITDLNCETCACLLTFDPVLPLVLCWSYNVYGVVESYESNGYGWPPYVETRYRIFVTGIGLNCDDDATVKNIKSLYNLNNVQCAEYFDLKGHFTTPLTAVYQHDDYLYVKDVDDCYGLVVGAVAGTFHNGDLITNAVAKAQDKGCEWHISPVDANSFVKGEYGHRVYPETMPLAAVDKSMIHRYLQFDGVAIEQDEIGDCKMIDYSGDMGLDNRFDVLFPPRESVSWALNDGEINIADVNLLIAAILKNEQYPQGWDGTYDVSGFLSNASGRLMLIPTVISRHGNFLDCNDDNELNIADLNVLIDAILSK